MGSGIILIVYGVRLGLETAAFAIPLVLMIVYYVRKWRSGKTLDV
ncbi:MULTISPECIES: hypothetical protein [Paenibacillus]|nr:hypothetical protein [Paenibacillus macerans]MDU5945945.1 hypothetical protein [Paenibacillus macerans]MEC0151338.1 hypothetical protein [Paenibacillus macerans]MEC0328817.1 hypothetical protein [Paenibacillus macerans]GBK62950.1 hypothetical protein PbDSM24746_29540 [Paenibacillus macerans]GBK69262.1 hypothetical protein PbJCM17693_29700 [Paenibacillus macerans]